MNDSRSLFLSLICLAWALSSSLVVAGGPAAASDLGSAAAPSAVEPLSKGLTTFSQAIRHRDFTELGHCFHEFVQLGGGLPRVRQTHPPTSLVVHSRSLGTNVRNLRRSRDEGVANWKALLSRFRTIEDAHFAADDATPAGSNPAWVQDSEVRFAIVGRDDDGSRLWLTGTGRIDADFVTGRGWRFSRLEIDRIDEYRMSPLMASAQPRTVD